VYWVDRRFTDTITPSAAALYFDDKKIEATPDLVKYNVDHGLSVRCVK
jgi:hypothetical protein